jgi:Na+-translocating ferredoxin:NAD+ oxidoreductase subunit B
MQTLNHDATVTSEAVNVNGKIDADQIILIERIDDILPQTQCQQCGYQGCNPYAAALAQGQAQINQCPPGGEAGIQALANLLNLPYIPLNTSHGLIKPKAVAIIDEQHCIGCTLCIKACPVDAILGASKQMHTVISQECTGCELCIAPCPVDCITMQPVSNKTQSDALDNKTAADLARKRHQNRQMRLALEKQQRAQTYAKRHHPSQPVAESTLNAANNTASSNTDAIKKAAIAAAMARVKAQKNSPLESVKRDVSG